MNFLKISNRGKTKILKYYDQRGYDETIKFFVENVAERGNFDAVRFCIENFEEAPLVDLLTALAKIINTAASDKKKTAVCDYIIDTLCDKKTGISKSQSNILGFDNYSEIMKNKLKFMVFPLVYPRASLDKVYKLAHNVPFCNMERCAERIIKSKDPQLNFYFAKNIPDADIEAHFTAVYNYEPTVSRIDVLNASFPLGIMDVRLPNSDNQYDLQRKQYFLKEFQSLIASREIDAQKENIKNTSTDLKNIESKNPANKIEDDSKDK